MAGRPSKYHTHVEPKLMLIEAWARDGLTEQQICNNLDISQESLIQYKKEYSELSEALKRGREVIDVMVENALLKAAIGYDYHEEEINKATGEIVALQRTAHPNTTALIFWLKNRKPKQWRDKHELEHSGDLSIKVALPQAPGDDDADG